MSDAMVWLCFRADDGWTLAAVYHNADAAEAWLDGIQAGYAGGKYIAVPTNSGPFDLADASTDRNKKGERL